jgi:hypothetical protein
MWARVVCEGPGREARRTKDGCLAGRAIVRVSRPWER